MSNYVYEETSYLKDITKKHIHMIGIGGSSMSGLAEFLIHLGFNVSGSDSNESENTKRLMTLGADVHIGHSPENITDPGLAVYTVAVKEDNPEYKEVIRKNIPIIDRSKLLGELMSIYPKSISVSGTHGKTTTTSMITTILMDSGRNPNMHIGGTIINHKSSVLIGGDEFFVNEACEYYNSFLHFKSFMGVILNIESDHLDFFGSFENILDAFCDFVSIISQDGYLVVCKDDEPSMKVASSAGCKVITYSIKDASADIYAGEISFGTNGFGKYNLYINNELKGPVELNVPGTHNISNSLASIGACFNLGCSVEECIKGINTFKGTSRRFEIKGTYNNITVVDDYAHHPSEIKATLDSLKNTSYNKVRVVFQPHTYTRAKKLFNEFSESFKNCDEVIVTDIYAAREQDPGDIHSSLLAEGINKISGNAVYKDSLQSAADYLKNTAQSGDIIITLGAGTVNQICKMLLGN